MTSSTATGSSPVRSTSARMTGSARCGASISANAPPKEPNGVLSDSTIKISFIVHLQVVGNAEDKIGACFLVQGGSRESGRATKQAALTAICSINIIQHYPTALPSDT